MRRCTHASKRFCGRCMLVTIGFPIEHFVWEKLPMFRNVTALLGL